MHLSSMDLFWFLFLKEQPDAALFVFVCRVVILITVQLMAIMSVMTHAHTHTHTHTHTHCGGALCSDCTSNMEQVCCFLMACQEGGRSTPITSRGLFSCLSGRSPPSHLLCSHRPSSSSSSVCPVTPRKNNKNKKIRSSRRDLERWGEKINTHTHTHNWNTSNQRGTLYLSIRGPPMYLVATATTDEETCVRSMDMCVRFAAATFRVRGERTRLCASVWGEMNKRGNDAVSL